MSPPAAGTLDLGLPAPDPAERLERLPLPLMAAFAAAAFAVVFLPSLDNGFVSDDWVFLDAAARVSSIHDLGRLLAGSGEWFFRPLQWLLTVALYRLFGLWPAPYRVVSLALHLGSAALLFRLSTHLLEEPGTGGEEPGAGRSSALALLPALLFLFNPRQHEAVLWLSSVSEQLATLARLAALLVLWSALMGRRRAAARALVAALLYGLALLAKESAAFFALEAGLLVLLATATRRLGRHQSLRLAATALLPLALVAAAWLVHFLHQSDSGKASRVGLTLLDPTPAGLLFRYAHALVRTQTSTSLPGSWPSVWFGAAVVALVVALAAVARRRLWLFALAWTFAALTPCVLTTSVWDASHGVPVELRETGIFDCRYYNYPIAAAALLIALSLWWAADELRRALGSRPGRWAPSLLVTLVASAILLSGAAALRDREQEWDTAGRIAARIIAGTVAALPSPEPGTTICFVGLPDSYRGRFVFRNGIQQALHLAFHRRDFAVADPTTNRAAPCQTSLAWDGTTVTFLPR